MTFPSLTAITIWSTSPETFGALRCSSRTASKLCVCGRLKLSLKELPAAVWIAVTPTTAAIQASTTIGGG